MALTLRLLLVAPPDAAAGAVARLRLRGPVSPALVPSAELLAAALQQGGWDALLVLPGAPVPLASIAELAVAEDAPRLFVEAATRPPALAGAVHLFPGETASLHDHLATVTPPTDAPDPGGTEAARAEPAPPDAPSLEAVVPEAVAPRLSGTASVPPWDTAFHLATPRSTPEAPEEPAPAEAPLAQQAHPDGDSLGSTERLARDLPIGVYRSSPSGRILFGNPACARALGLRTVDELYGLDLRSDLDYPREHFAALMASDGVVRNLITTWTRPDGQRIHTREHAREVRDAEGAARYFEGTIEDVTDEVEARRAADRRRRQHEATASFAAVAEARPSPATLFEEAAVAAHHALGAAWTLLVRRSGEANTVAAWAGPLSASDVHAWAGTPEVQALPLDELRVDVEAAAFQPLLDVCAGHAVATFPLMQGERSLGALVAAYEEAPPGEDDLRTGEALAWHLASHLARLRAERDLSDSEATLRYVAEHVDTVLFRQRADGTYDYISPGIERLTGIAAADFVARGGLDALATDRTHLTEADGSSSEAGPHHVRYTFLHADGAPRVVETRARAWYSADGTLLGRVGAYHDVTDHVAATASLRDARDEAVEQAEAARQEALQRSAALAELSHEVRTPLTSVIGFAEVLAGELTGELAEVAETIVESGQTMLDTINAVLDHARLESEGARPELVPTDLGAAAAAAAERLRSLADDKGLALDVAVADGVMAALDTGSLNRIVTNLVGNAVKYTEAGAVRVAVETDAADAVLRVRDSGVGIPESVREHLFEPFRAGDHATPNSSGLGLSIVKRLVDLLGGTISVEDRAPGTEVSVRFARLHPPATPSAHPTPELMTHPLPTSDDGQPDAPYAPHQGDGHAAFVARPQPTPAAAPPGFAPAPPAGFAPAGPAVPAAPPQPPAYGAPQAYPPPHAPQGHAPAGAAQQPGYAPTPPPAPAPVQGPPPAPSGVEAPGAPPPVPGGFAPPSQQAFAPAQPTSFESAPPPAFVPAPPASFEPTPPAAFAPAQPAPAPPAPAAPAPAQPAPYAPPSAPYSPSAAPQESFGASQESFGAPPAAAAAPAAEAAPPAAAQDEASAALHKARILVVEDNNDTRMLLDRILRRTYDVTAVGDARSALVAMHNTRFDGLVLDINLGGKETGADILRIARSLDGYQGVFAIALTAYALPGDRERLLEKGFSEYISKPFTRSSLMEALAKGVAV